MSMLLKLATTISETWTLWQGTKNVKVELLPLILNSLIIVLALSWFSWILKSKKVNPPLPPGPRPLPLVGNLLSLKPELHSYTQTLAETYGPILTLLLGKKVAIVVTSPTLAREVLKDQDTNFANRDVPVAGKEGTYGGSDIVSAPYGPGLLMLRKVCIREMLGHSTLDSVYPLRRREVRNTISYFYSQVGSPVNLGEQMFLTVMNVITNMMWGGSLKEGKERASLASEFRQVVAGITTLLGLPNISDLYPGLARFDLQGIIKKMKVLVLKFDSIFEIVISQRTKMDIRQQSNDFLQCLLKLKDNGDAKVPLTMSNLKALLMNMVVGGTDTTSNSMEFAIAEMLNKPETMEKAQQELLTVVGKDNIVEEYHLPKLPYLYAVMKEVLRLHPALPMLVPHCPSETCIVGGYTIPKGSQVFINVWAIHRDPSIWENPLEFCPERFLTGKWDFSGNDFKYFPFGSGRRICAGTAMGERMFMYSLASVLHSFDWKLPQGQKLDLEEKFGLVLKKKIPLIVIPTPRLSNPSLYE